jgi:hypothetical protein
VHVKLSRRRGDSLCGSLHRVATHVYKTKGERGVRCADIDFFFLSSPEKDVTIYEY